MKYQLFHRASSSQQTNDYKRGFFRHLYFLYSFIFSLLENTITPSRGISPPLFFPQEKKKRDKERRKEREKRVWLAILQKLIGQTYINGQLYSPPTMSIIQSISVLHYKNHKKYK